MTAALRFELPRRYDTTCAFCGDGEPVGRHRGKACCGKCKETFGEAKLLSPLGERELARVLLGVTKDHWRLWPLWRRALLKRGQHIPAGHERKKRSERR